MHRPRTLSRGTFIQGDLNADIEGEDELSVLTDFNRKPDSKANFYKTVSCQIASLLRNPNSGVKFLAFTIIFRDVTRTLIGRGCIFIYSCYGRRVSFQIDQFEFDLKRNSSGRT